tara:strand:+ start:6804 stop:7706 length:903 start_codon:yes stop_codon:yes gene_type:complete
MKTYPKIVLAGSVNSSYQTLKKLHEHKMDVVHVLALHPEKSEQVSGYKDLKMLAEELSIPASYFKNINDLETQEVLIQVKADILFVIGLSQIVKSTVLNIPTHGCIGFHPTMLPEGRGRAAIAWTILKSLSPGVTFFQMDHGVDSGPIHAQVPIELASDEYPLTLIEKIKSTIDVALDEWLPKLHRGSVNLRPQNHAQATYLGVRREKDGCIQWKESAEEVYKLIRASSHPYPGAFSFVHGEKIKIYSATLRPEFTGISGRVLAIEHDNPIIACAKGAIELGETQSAQTINWKIGMDLDL